MKFSQKSFELNLEIYLHYNFYALEQLVNKLLVNKTWQVCKKKSVIFLVFWYDLPNCVG